MFHKHIKDANLAMNCPHTMQTLLSLFQKGVQALDSLSQTSLKTSNLKNMTTCMFANQFFSSQIGCQLETLE